MFSSYKKTVDMIISANEVELSVCSIGFILFRMYDGVVREASNMKYVHTSLHNLISLGQLDHHDCIYGT